MPEPDTTWAQPESPTSAVTPEPGAQAPSPVVVPRKPGGGLVNAVLVLGALVAVGGIAFAVGRSTAPVQGVSLRGSAAGQGVTQGSQGLTGGLPGGSFDPAQVGSGGTPGGSDRTMTISGTVSSFDGTTLVLTTASGSETAIDVSGASYHRQAAASSSDVHVGAAVSVASEALGFRRPDASADPGVAAGGSSAGPGTLAATDVTITGE